MVGTEVHGVNPNPNYNGLRMLHFCKVVLENTTSKRINTKHS